ncbi:sensor histidine kinase [Streptomyces piniterrae]|uniref:Sensor histidine kinase n=1 Tax=Streptomyces piniterrae TaxID=2571125 RepID=A0A4U0NJQ8_9ACTN|nr:sensor histidine kinase [Streptomyces piniterrae]TJZ54323.1 sensor histidine kinase [Streptomyces piniterrae]
MGPPELDPAAPTPPAAPASPTAPTDSTAPTAPAALRAVQAHAYVEQRWGSFIRWGPYAFLGVGTLLSVATAAPLMSTGDRYAAAALVPVALALQLWWSRANRRHTGPSVASTVYYALRWALAFTLTWLNPLFAFYAVLGYFGAERLLPRRLVRIGLIATAVIMAGSNSGGLPPSGQTGWLLFGGVLAAHIGLLYVFSHLSAQEEERTRVQADTIAELEDTNARLQQALDENAALHAQLLVQAREAGVSDERRRLAAEIHDTLAQGLTGIIAQLQVVANATDPALARGHLDRAADLARHSLGEARRSVQNLGPFALEHHALPEALKATLTEWAGRVGARAEFTVTGTAEPLHEEIEGTLVRIAQEALSNTARHAKATRVGVTLSYMDDEVALDVRDDGHGFDPLALPPRSGSGGFGLDGMRARAERVAGTVEVESEPGHGTAVSARVPLVRHD